jgi:hypothetical protein
VPRGEITCKQQQLRSCKRNAIVDHQVESIITKKKMVRMGTTPATPTKHAIAVNSTCLCNRRELSKGMPLSSRSTTTSSWLVDKKEKDGEDGDNDETARMPLEQ